jgi:hypothetical protein
MTIGSAGKGPNMTQRAVMQHLSLTVWKLANRLAIPAGEMMLSRIAHLGWIKVRGDSSGGSQANRGRAQGHAVEDFVGLDNG